jgi:signal transduction histidine kinase
MTTDNKDSFRFRPKARILRLLGDQLIGNPRLAIFELVKNAFDADAENVTVTLSDLGSENGTISIRDDGDGMNLHTIENVWFVPGADYREKQRLAGKRTENFKRLPLGEKGLGRFAVHKLGDRINLITRSRLESVERIVHIDWAELLDDRYLENLNVEVNSRIPVNFDGNKHGTLIVIGALREKNWTRGELRRLYRQVTSICSPFAAPREFQVKLEVPGREHDLAGLPSVDDILEYAFWHYSFSVDENGFKWSYRFINRLSGVDISNREVSGNGEHLALDDRNDDSAEETMPLAKGRKNKKENITVDASFIEGIGSVTGEFYVFDRDKEVLSRMSEPDMVTKYLNENGGVRVYRDGIRVYNYGERGDDWLGLDLRRVNQPSLRVSRNVIVGAINLTLEKSLQLVEKTNREGFVENTAYSRLRRIVLAGLSALEAEREPDKERLRTILKGEKGTERFDAAPPFEGLRKEAKKLGAEATLEPYIKRIETEFNSLKETLVHAGMSGVGLAVIFHEVDRGVRELYSIVRAGSSQHVVERKAKDLSLLLDGFSTLLRRSDSKNMKATELIKRARDVSAARFRFHQTYFECPLLEGAQADFEAKMAQGLMLGAITNLIDNSLYWLRVKWPELEESQTKFVRKLYVGTSNDLEGGPAIIIADNGPGLKDSPDSLTKPFFTRRPDGMGLGLYYVKLAMELAGGSIQFPEPGDVNVPEGYDGAVIALVFNRANKE